MATIDLPQADTEILATWGQAVAKAINGVQRGTLVCQHTNSPLSASTQLTFPKAYATPPVVVAIAANANYTVAVSEAPTATGVKLQTRRADATNQTIAMTVYWIAIGDPA